MTEDSLCGRRELYRNSIRRLLIFLTICTVVSGIAVGGVSGAVGGPQSQSSPTTQADNPPTLSPSGSGLNTSVVWHTNVTQYDNSTKAIYQNGTVYAVAGKTIVAIDATTGERLREKSFGNSISLATTGPETVYVVEDIGDQVTIQAIDTATFNVRWSNTLSEYDDPVASSEHFYTLLTLSGNDTVVAIDATTGETAWQQNFSQEFGVLELPDLTLGSKPVYQGDTGISVMDSSDGTVVWSTSVRSEPWPRVTDNTVVGVTEKPPTKSAGQPYAIGFDSNDGSVKYEEAFEADFTTEGSQSLVLANGNPYFFDIEFSSHNAGFTKIVGFNPTTGAQTGTIDYDQGLFAIGVSDNSQYLVTAGDTANKKTKLFVANTTTNTKTGSITFPDPDAVLAVAGHDLNGNTLYVNTQNGSVAAIEMTPTEQSTVTIDEAIAGDDETIGITDIQQAIRYWANDETVPNTGGKTISIVKIQSLIQQWASGG